MAAQVWQSPMALFFIERKETVKILNRSASPKAGTKTGFLPLAGDFAADGTALWLHPRSHGVDTEKPA